MEAKTDIWVNYSHCKFVQPNDSQTKYKKEKEMKNRTGKSLDQKWENKYEEQEPRKTEGPAIYEERKLKPKNTLWAQSRLTP